MKIIIDIDEKYRDTVQKKINHIAKSPKCLADLQIMKYANELKILPKGHGRLIDADAFISTLEDASKRHKYKELLIGDCLTVDDVFKAIIESLQNKGLAEGDTPTIIEADKESD